MKTDDELLEAAKELYKRLGGIGNPDARLVRGLMERWQSARSFSTARTSGPATAKLIRCIKADLEPSDTMIDAFLAEHKESRGR